MKKISQLNVKIQEDLLKDLKLESIRIGLNLGDLVELILLSYMVKIKGDNKL